ncbi:hypothetical protein DRO29_01755 [Candidatus Bathyarchaeota archaeon]|nr:MAG: hypothetical protein DRO29_01755 [Candidatus Bathyarchaeota archaeon]
MEKLRIALIGCGGIAEAHLNGYKDLHNRGLEVFDLTAVCDISREMAETKAEKIKAFQGRKPNVYTDLGDILKNESLDAVDICTPHNTHHQVASACLRHGLHVIIEKPLGITMRAARLIIDEAEKRGKILAVAENYRRTPENRAIWWAIRSGLIGKPRMIVWADVSWSPAYWGWREDKMKAGGSWVFDGGVHLADLDRYQLGTEASKVYAVNETFEPVREGRKVTVDDMTMAIIRYENGVYAQWLWTKVAPSKRIGMRIIYGSLGAITSGELQIQKGDHTERYPIETVKRRMMRSLDPQEIERMFPRGSTDTFAIELYDFYRSIVEGKRPEVDGWEAYKDMAIPLSFYESAALERPIRVKDVEDLRIENYQSEINEKLGL